jgi:hypothetical protein
MPPSVAVVPGSSRKRQVLTLNRTETRFGLVGTESRARRR